MEIRPHTADGLPPVRIRGAALLGLFTILLFFGGFAGWAATAPLGGAAIAPGAMNVDTNRKTVQHLEGGIVREILVREGDRVVAGQPLIVLDDTAPKARIRRLDSQISSARRQMKLIDEEIEAVSGLLRKGLARRPRLLALQRRHAELVGDLEDYYAQMRTAKDVANRTEVRAPVGGLVVALQVHSEGGVIKGGEPLLYVVPGKERLIVEARVDPIDVDVVHIGLRADVRLTPYNMRDMPPVPGTVQSLSADSFTDEHSGLTYYLARIDLDQGFLETLDDVEPTPGMPVEVMIYTGDRTALEYFLEPITRSFHRAFRES
jgi:multidrug efflux pump subunit AcrA (membrane-fusion protein)